MDAVEGDIRSGKYAADAPLPSVRALMRRFSASNATVRRALDLLQRKGVVRARPGSGYYIGHSKTGIIGLIVPGLAYSEFFAPIVSRVSQLCRRDGRLLLLGETLSQSHVVRTRRILDFADEIVRSGVDGVIFQPLEYSPESLAVNEKVCERFSEAKIPVVLLDYDIVPPPERSRYDVVGINNVDAGSRLANHLIESGARRIAFYVHPHFSPTMRRRLDGVRLAAAGRATVDLIEATADDARLLKRRLCGSRRPDAIVCGNDRMALEMLKILSGLSLRVPEDVLVAGFDDVKAASASVPPLTSIHQPCGDYAEAAYTTLMTRLGEGERGGCARDVFVMAPLVVRASTQRPHVRGKGRESFRVKQKVNTKRSPL